MDESQLLAIRMDDLLQQSIVTTNLYLKLSEAKYVVIAKAGTNLSNEHMQRLRERGIDVLYVRAKDYGLLLANGLSMAAQVVRDEKVKLGPKLTMLQSSSEAIFREIGQLGINRESFTRAKTHTDNILVFAQTNYPLSSLVTEMTGKEGGMVNHALQVSIVATMLGIAHDWRNPIVLERLALAAFFHDIGEVNFDKAMFTKPKEMFTIEEAEKYAKHPEIGRDLLSGMDFIPEEIPTIVFQHHENSVGNGFPQALKDAGIHPLARVVTLANEVCEHIFPTLRGPPRMPLAEIVSYIEIALGNPFNKMAVHALHRLVDAQGKKRSA
jgi:HD-GYP domain-containing protein (c-di-GMP phosphodiesterase class II)